MLRAEEGGQDPQGPGRREAGATERFTRRRHLGGIREQVHPELVLHALGRPGWGEVSGEPGVMSQAGGHYP